MFGRFLEISLNTSDIAASVQFYERLGFTQLTTGDTWPHPYGVLSDGRLGIALLEARTFSPARHTQASSLCGWFSGYSMPAIDTEAAQAFWEHAGFVSLELPEEPLMQLALTSDTLTLTLHRPRVLEVPLLVFTDPQMPERLAQLANLDVQGSGDL